MSYPANPAVIYDSETHPPGPPSSTFFENATNVSFRNSAIYNVTGNLTQTYSDLIATLPHAEARYNASVRNGLSSCLEGTRVALLRTINKWIEDTRIDEPRIFWLCGLAGTGKSTVAQTIAETLDGGINKRLAASFFFARASKDCSNALLVFSTIARQLALFNDEFGHYIAEALEANRDAGKLVMMAQLQKLIIEPLQRVKNSLSPIMIVMDALDECSDRKLAQDILILFAAEIRKLPFPLKIFITSRSELHIVSKFESPILKPISRPFILHDIEKAIVDGDIELFLKRSFATVAEQYGIIDPWPEEDVIVILRDRARGLFIFAATVVKYVADEYVGDPESQLEAVVEDKKSLDTSPYADIDKLYLQVLTSSLPAQGNPTSLVDRFQIVVGSIVLLIEPLPLEPLAFLLDKPLSYTSAALRFLHSVLIVPKVPTEDPVRIIHPSFYDYLTERCDDSRFAIDTHYHHQRISFRCIEVMLSMLQRNICQIDDPSKLNEEVQDLKARRTRHIPHYLSYACIHWGSHIAKISKRHDPGYLSLFRDFVKRKLLEWLEVLSVESALDVAIPALVAAESWYLALCEADDISEILKDAQRFCLEFYEPIQNAAGHVYLTALRLMPVCALARAYAVFVPDGLAFVRGKQERWGPILRSMYGHKNDVLTVQCSSNGNTIISASYDHTIRIWDAQTGSTKATLVGHRGIVEFAIFSPDEERIVSASADKTIRIWEPTTGATFSILRGHQDSVRSVGFSRDGLLILSASSDKTARVWSSANGQCIHTLQTPEGLNRATFNPDASLILTGSGGGRVALWDWKKNVQIFGIDVHSQTIFCVCFSSDGELIASTSDDGTARIMALDGSTVRVFAPHNGYIRKAIFTSDNKYLWTSDRKLRKWDIETGESIVIDPRTTIITSFDFLPGQKHIVVANHDNDLRILDLEIALEAPKADDHTKSVHMISISNDRKVMASGADDSTARIWDFKSGSLLAVLKHAEDVEQAQISVLSLAFNGSTSRLVTSGDKDVFVWDLGTRNLIVKVQGHTTVVQDVAFSPISDQQVASAAEGQVRIWDIETKTTLRILDHYEGLPVSCISYSPSGSHLLSGSYDCVVRIWDLKSGEDESLYGHSDWIQDVAWSPDGSLVASASADRTVRLWDATSAKELKVYAENSGRVGKLAFSLDATHIVSKCDAKMARFLPLPDFSPEKCPQMYLFVDEGGWIMQISSTGMPSRLCWLPATLRPYRYLLDVYDEQSRSLVLGASGGPICIIRLVT